jgi:hypothetical protein
MSATDRPFINDATQREKQEVLRSEQKLRKGDRQATTYHAQAMAGLDEPGGRFAQARYVTGQEPGTNYPRLPESSPWSGDQVPPEEPLGVAIDAQEPVGEFFEVEASLAASSNPALSQRVRTASVEDDGAASHSTKNLAGDSSQTAAAVGSAANSAPAASKTSPAIPPIKRTRRKLT